MKRGRGRPQGTAKHGDHISLVWFVRNARDQGSKVAEACRQYLNRIEGVARPSDELIQRYKRKYERTASAYPDRHIEATPEHRRAIARRLGMSPMALDNGVRRRRIGLATAQLLPELTRKPTAY